MQEKYHLVLIGYGLLVSKKYREIIDDYFPSTLTAITVIELEGKEDFVNSRISEFSSNITAKYTPPDSIKCLEELINHSSAQNEKVRVIIATEVRAHELYLQYCIDNNIDFIVEKPVVCPVKDGTFYPEGIKESMDRLSPVLKEATTNSAVMCLSRNHEFYNDNLLKKISTWVAKYQQPVTSIHLHTNSGIWNLNTEYVSREDHPYKYGYGMLMHGAYHYVDIFAQIINENRRLYPEESFELFFSAIGAFPTDQEKRIPPSTASRIGEDQRFYDSDSFNNQEYGETDVCSTFKMVNSSSGHTLTIGTLSFEQTTPCIRSWNTLDPTMYNKNGRTSHTDIIVQLATLMSIQTQTYKVNESESKSDYCATELVRVNDSLLPEFKRVSFTNFENFSNSKANEALLRLWLEDKETKSSLKSHLLTMDITYALAMSLKHNREINIKLEPYNE